MFKIILTATISLFSVSSFALDTLTCGFTEPFITVEYDANTKIVTKTGVEDYNEATGEFLKIVISENAEIKLAAPDQVGVYDLVDVATGTVILSMELNGNGTDGMSDRLYPFSAVYENNYGGCSTETAPVVDTVNVMEQLGASYY
jgi:uncharacterized membrane protein